MKRTLLIVLSAMLILAAFGCSSKAAAPQAYYNGASNSYYAEAAYDMPAAMTEEAEFYDEAKTSASAYGENVQTPALNNRKIIRNADLSVQTLEFDAFLEKLNAQVESLGGFIETSNIGGRTYYNQTKLRTAYLSIRIPAEKLDAFLSVVDGLGNVTQKSTGMRDVTTNYIDNEKHLEALRTEQEALLKILESATTVEDLITVQNRLSEVRYEIESYESILRSYDDQIDLSTVSLTLNEVERETVVEPETFWEEVSRRFKESMEDVGENFEDFFAGFLGNAPHIIFILLFFGVQALIIVLIVRGCKKRSQKRKAEKEAQKQS